LVYDNHIVEQEKTLEEGYHLTEDLVDKAISFITETKQVAPNKPFFMYFCPGAMHAPHHVPKEWADKYQGEFDDGWDAYREVVFAHQKELGIAPPFEFTGTIDSVTVDVSGELFKDTEAEMRQIMARQ
jgi:arylsulfatase